MSELTTWERLVLVCADGRSQFSRMWNHNQIRRAVIEGSYRAKQLEIENTQLRGALGKYADGSVERLEAENARLRETLEWYANDANWDRALVEGDQSSKYDDWWLPSDHGYTLARKVLEER